MIVAFSMTVVKKKKKIDGRETFANFYFKHTDAVKSALQIPNRQANASFAFSASAHVNAPFQISPTQNKMTCAA